MTDSIGFQTAVAAMILLVAVGSVELGYRIGVRTTKREAPDNAHLGAVQGAILGLLGLLLGFSFAGASSRFIERQDLIVREANAIGTAYLRADLLNEPHRAALKTEVLKYADLRIALYDARKADRLAAVSTQCIEQHEAVWKAAIAGVREMPSVSNGVLPSVNEMIDLHSVRSALIRRHLPIPVAAALGLCAVVALATVGFSGGLSKRRNGWLTWSLALLFAVVLWVTLDLDYPRRGLIRVSNQPMLDLRASMNAG